MAYRAPVAETVFFLEHCTSLGRLAGKGALAELSPDLVAQVLEEAGKFATDKIAPLNRVGDKEGTPFANGVVMPKGWSETYRAWAADGWNAVTGPAECGGQGLPSMVGTAVRRILARRQHGLRRRPDADPGGDRRAGRARHRRAQALYPPQAGVRRMDGHHAAHRAAGGLGPRRAAHPRDAGRTDGSYRLKGQKIFITYGDHDLPTTSATSCSRALPDAPPGMKGISLFLVPKFLLKDDGALGPRNDLRCGSRRAQARASTARPPA